MRSTSCFEYSNIPLTGIVPRSDTGAIIGEIMNYGARYLVFTSTIGSDLFFSHYHEPHTDHVFLAIGSQTLKSIRGHGFDGVKPDRMDSSGLGDLIASLVKKGEKVALIRSNRSSMELHDMLKKTGIDFREFTIYSIVEKKGDVLEKFILKNQVFGIIVTSSMEADILSKTCGEIIKSSDINLFPIGTPTETTLVSAGLKNIALKGNSSVESLIAEIEKKYCHHSGEWI